MESLLKRALEKTELRTDAQEALDRLNPDLRDCQLLLIETATALFEALRAALYQSRLLAERLQETRAELRTLQTTVAASATSALPCADSAAGPSPAS